MAAVGINWTSNSNHKGTTVYIWTFGLGAITYLVDQILKFVNFPRKVNFLLELDVDHLKKQHVILRRMGNTMKISAKVHKIRKALHGECAHMKSNFHVTMVSFAFQYALHWGEGIPESARKCHALRAFCKMRTCGSKKVCNTRPLCRTSENWNLEER